VFKKLLLILTIVVIGQCSYAISKDDLNIAFFSNFNDDCLVYYINSALENNHNLKKADAVVEQYRQQVKYSFVQNCRLSLSVQIIWG